MINLDDPLIKRLIENLHKAVERKNKNLSLTSYDEYIKENRIIKIFCEDKTRGPRQCAAEMNARYQTELDNEDIIRVLKANRLSYQDKRAELLNWAEEMIATFAKALETHKPKDFDEFMTIRNRVIRTNDDERYKIQERIASLMLYVKHPELDSGTDAEAIEKFGNVYMKHFIYDASDFLRNICHKAEDSKIVTEMTFNDFLLFLQTKYPELVGNIDFTIFDRFDGVLMKELLIEAKNFLRGLPHVEINDEDFTFDTTVEDFLQSDPDAQNMLIAPPTHNAVD